VDTNGVAVLNPETRTLSVQGQKLDLPTVDTKGAPAVAAVKAANASLPSPGRTFQRRKTDRVSYENIVYDPWRCEGGGGCFAPGENEKLVEGGDLSMEK